MCVFGFIISGQTNACTISRNRDLAEIPPISIFIRGEITKEFRSFWTRKLASENLVPPLVLHSIVNKSEREWPFLCVACANCFVFLFKKNKQRRKHQKKKRSAPRDGWPPPSPVTSSSNYTTKNPLKIPPPSLSLSCLPCPKSLTLTKRKKVSQPDVPWQLLCVG